jgi:hypothetical protein
MAQFSITQVLPKEQVMIDIILPVINRLRIMKLEMLLRILVIMYNNIWMNTWISHIWKIWKEGKASTKFLVVSI